MAEPSGREPAPPGLLPLRVSLIVAMRNEVTSLPALVASIRGQTRSPDEVIFVDGGSTDHTVEVARTLAPPDYRILEAGPASPGRGRNIGIGAASHEWIALTDAGIRLDPTWLERLLETVERDPQVDVVYGNYEPVLDSPFERVAALAYVPPKMPRLGGWMRGPVVPSSLLRKTVWEAVGGFPDHRAAEDLMFMERIEVRGFRIGWAPRATVWWHLQPSIWRTFRRFTLYSKHNVWAGRQRHWHYGVARQYLLALPFLLLGLTHSFWWLTVPALGGVARVFRRIWSHQEGRGLGWAINPVRLTGVGLVLTVIDLATFIGWSQAACSTNPYRKGEGSAHLPSAAPPTNAQL